MVVAIGTRAGGLPATVGAALLLTAFGGAAAAAVDTPGLTPSPDPPSSSSDVPALPPVPLAAAGSHPLLGVPATGEAFERASLCLTQAIYYESGTEPRTGQQAVAQVVINRLRRPGFPKSVCGVVYQGAERATGCQFTFACDGSLARRPEARAWTQAREVAIEALQDGPADVVGDSTHYHASWMTPYWRSSMHETARIGGHIFYRPSGPDDPAPAAALQYAGSEPDRATPPPAVAGTSRTAGRGRRATGWAIIVPQGYAPTALLATH